MYKFVPTYPIGETAQNIRQYVKDHKDAFWGIVKPLLPFIIGLNIMDAIVSEIISTEEVEANFALGQILSGYLFTVIAISWHRIVIHGPDEFVPMNPSRPQRSEIKFILVGFGLAILGFIGGLISAVVPALLSPAVMFVTIPLFTGFALFIGVRLSFYFPALATNNPIKFSEAFTLSKGYIWALFASGFLVSWRVVLLTIGYVIIGGIIIGITFAFIGNLIGLAPNITSSVASSLLLIPIVAYLQPLLIVLGVTALSNYYQHALQFGGPEKSRRVV